MIAVNQDELIEQTTTAALEEKAKLKKHFGRFDMLFFLICTLVGLDTLGAVASNGAQGFTWLAFLAVVFFVPYALLTAELGSTFTEEGGSYIWVKLAFGRFVAAIRSVLYRIPWGNTGVWVCGVLWARCGRRWRRSRCCIRDSGRATRTTRCPTAGRVSAAPTSFRSSYRSPC